MQQGFGVRVVPVGPDVVRPGQVRPQTPLAGEPFGDLRTAQLLIPADQFLASGLVEEAGGFASRQVRLPGVNKNFVAELTEAIPEDRIARHRGSEAEDRSLNKRRPLYGGAGGGRAVGRYGDGGRR
ncbi:hypothetical protein ACWDFL_37825 [Streptomyces bungoensis]